MKTGSAGTSQKIKGFHHSRLGANVSVAVAASYFGERYQGDGDTKQYSTLLRTLRLLSSRDQSLSYHVTVVELLPSDKQPGSYFRIQLGNNVCTKTSKQQGWGRGHLTSVKFERIGTLRAL